MSDRKRVTDDHRRAVALAWLEAHAEGEEQTSFCSRQNPPITTRTLRHWVRQHVAKTTAPSAEETLVAVLATLNKLLAAVDELTKATVHSDAAAGMPLVQPSSPSAPGTPALSSSNSAAGMPPAPGAEPSTRRPAEESASAGPSRACRRSFEWNL